MRVAINWLLAICVFGTVAMAQTAPDGAIEEVRAERDLYLEAANAAAIRVSELQLELSNLAQNEPNATHVISAYNRAQIDHYKYEQDLREHSVAVLEWQLAAGWSILLLVLGVTGLGIWLSYLEVMGSLQNTEKKDALIKNNDLQAALNSASPSEKTELILSLQKIQVTSAITGVVILVLSLGFLYLFVDRVFSLNPTNLSEAAAQTSDLDGTESDGESSVESED